MRHFCPRILTSYPYDIEYSGFLQAKVEIRPFQPISQEFSTKFGRKSYEKIYNHTFNDEIRAECEFVKLSGVYMKKSTSITSAISDETYENLKDDCQKSGQDGWQCNVFTSQGSHMSPFPLFSLLENPDVFVSINNQGRR